MLVHVAWVHSAFSVSSLPTLCKPSISLGRLCYSMSLITGQQPRVELGVDPKGEGIFLQGRELRIIFKQGGGPAFIREEWNRFACATGPGAPRVLRFFSAPTHMPPSQLIGSHFFPTRALPGVADLPGH